MKDASRLLEEFPGELRDRFTPLGHLGSGAMGSVFLVEESALERRVAIKLLGVSPDAEMTARFRREAESLARVRHPHVLQVYDHGLTDAGPYIVMEYLEGVAIDAAPGARPLELMLEVADGLEAIHRAGLVHRDLKPENILFTADRRPVIVDFGLVFDPRRTKLTRAGAVVGTLAYMAPEVLRTRPVTPACDWYSWGVVLFRLVERRLPYTLPDVLEVAKGHALPPLEFESLAPDGPTARLLERVLSERPERRPVTRRDLLRLLEEQSSLEEALDEPTFDEQPTAEFACLDADTVGSRLAPGAAGRRRGWLVAGLAGLALGLGLLVSDGPRGEPGAPREPPPAPVDEGFAARLRAELAAAGERHLDRWGTLASADAADDPARDVRPLLDPDPLRWGALTRHLPAVRVFHRWVAAGGRTEAISQERREVLRALDEEFIRRGLPRPFHPYAYLRPAPGPVPLPAAFAGPAWEPLDLPARAEGWTGACYAALRDALTHHHQLSQAFARGGEAPPPGFPPPVWEARRLYRFDRFYEFVRAASDNQALRPALAALLGRGAAMLHAALHAAGRATREEPDAAPALAMLFTKLGARVTAFLYTAPLFMEAEVVLGGPARTPAGALLEAQLRRFQVAVQRRLGQDPPAEERARIRELLREAARPPEPDASRPSRQLAALARQGLVLHHLGPPVDRAALSSLVRDRWYGFDDLPPWGRAQVLDVLLRGLFDAPARWGLGVREVERLAGGMQEVVEELPPARRRRLEAEVLPALRGGG